MRTVVVIGAGAAGLSAAGRLAAAGVGVTVLDKGRGVGGRLATRRIGAARLDHGAQFFTSRSEEFTGLTRAWLGRGVAREWCRGFRQPADGHPRFVGASGMTDLAKDLASGLDVRTSTRVESVSAAPDGRWVATLEGGRTLVGAGGDPLRADAVISTAPVPQTLEMLGPAVTDTRARRALGAISYEPTLAGLLVLAEPSALPHPGGVQLDRGAVTWIGDNQAKGISPVPAVTVHAAGRGATDSWDGPEEAILASLEAAARPLIGPAPVLERQLARWRYATPSVSHDARCLVAVDGGRPLVCAGDAFGEAKVEGAVRSGWAAAEAVLDRLAP